MKLRALMLGVVLAGLMSGGAYADEDRYIGYYYPKPDAVETFESMAKTAIDTSRNARIDFVNGLTQSQMSHPYPAQFAVYAKGDDADKLIVTCLQSGYGDTLYRMRAVLAMMTAMARQTEFFKKNGVDKLFTFLDLVKILGFKSLVFTDGEDFAHQFVIKQDAAPE